MRCVCCELLRNLIAMATLETQLLLAQLCSRVTHFFRLLLAQTEEVCCTQK